ncbi:MAG: hypothetical protein KatS3mg102_0822 [Planctomycetota bacterium]|nr:MAG: hypothetical protein KatS3mg102_0822 [Planctomycetota bacterium]
MAFKLAWALAGEVSPGARVRPELREFLLDAMALVAIGTVADAVPLLDENRILVHYGLRALAASPHPGLRALLRVARLEHGVPSAEDVAFQLAPRLNAAGRMGRAELALELLSCEEEQRAAQLAEALDAENRRRRALEREVLAQALDGAERALAQTDGAAIVSAAPGWHPGVIGIVASRLVERYHRPAVLIALDEQGLGRGSARSIPGVRLHAALARCEDLLLRHGGHAQAAGLEIRAERVEPFRRRLGEALAEELASALAAPDGPAPLQVDLELPLGTISETLVRELECLGPHGLANRPPLFSASGLRLAAPPRAVGGGEHLQLSLAQGGTVRRAIGFRLAGKLPELERGGALCAAFRPTLSRYGGGTRVELELADLCPACPPG